MAVKIWCNSARGPKSWQGKYGQSAEWASCLTAAKLPRIRHERDEAQEPKPQFRLQGENAAEGAVILNSYDSGLRSVLPTD
jgi:hypothetical protein